MKRRRIITRVSISEAERALADLIAAEQAKRPGINRNVAIQFLGEKVRPLLAVSNFIQQHRVDLQSVFSPDVALPLADAETSAAFARARADIVDWALRFARGETDTKPSYVEWGRVRTYLRALEYQRYAVRLRHHEERRKALEAAHRESGLAATRQCRRAAARLFRPGPEERP